MGKFGTELIQMLFKVSFKANKWSTGHTSQQGAQWWTGFALHASLPLGRMSACALSMRVQAQPRYSLYSLEAALIGFGVSHHCFMKRRA